MAEIHRVLELLGMTVAGMLDRLEQLEADNAALQLLVRPSPVVPIAEVPVRDLSLSLDEDRE